MKLVRMRAKPDGIDLLFPLVVYPDFDHVGGKHIVAKQERVSAFERVKRLVKRSGRRFHLLRLSGRQIIKILVDRLAGVDAVSTPSRLAINDGNANQYRSYSG
jgi:hypothetical protein